MIAVVSNPQSRTYFLREGDRLYDGSVEKISMDSVSFHEEEKTAFENPSDVKGKNEFNPIQENCNENEFAGPSAWLPNPFQGFACDQPRGFASPRLVHR